MNKISLKWITRSFLIDSEAGFNGMIDKADWFFLWIPDAFIPDLLKAPPVIFLRNW